MQVLSDDEVKSVAGGYSMFDITISTTVWGGLLSLWKGDPIWLVCGLATGLILSATKVADDKLGYTTKEKTGEIDLRL
ncbi:MAG: hypothetical protein AB7D28_00800 [Candidatus Berkiella sp.]|jgi:hypothetical protein